MLASAFIPLLSLFAVASAQSSTAASDASSAVATAAAGTNGYTYAGCWNETTGVEGTTGARALSGGKMVQLSQDTPSIRHTILIHTQESNDTATVTSCLEYCGASNYQYAGLEYAQEYVQWRKTGQKAILTTRRCWCSNYFSALSTQLPESNCSLACKGNDTELCGGYLTITLYNLTSKSSGSSSSSSKTGTATSTVASGWTYVLGAGVMALALGSAL